MSCLIDLLCKNRGKFVLEWRVELNFSRHRKNTKKQIIAEFRINVSYVRNWSVPQIIQIYEQAYIIYTHLSNEKSKLLY